MHSLIDFPQIFGREAPRLLAIGFGSGQSLLALASAHPDKDFIGVETHKPGLGALFLGIERAALTNLRVYDGDAIDVQPLTPHCWICRGQLAPRTTCISRSEDARTPDSVSVEKSFPGAGVDGIWVRRR